MNSKTIILITLIFGTFGAGYWYWRKNTSGSNSINNISNNISNNHRYDSNGMRMFTLAQCDALGGRHYPSGECLKKQGGSFSYDMRRR